MVKSGFASSFKGPTKSGNNTFFEKGIWKS